MTHTLLSVCVWRNDLYFTIGRGPRALAAKYSCSCSLAFPMITVRSTIGTPLCRASGLRPAAGSEVNPGPFGVSAVGERVLPDGRWFEACKLYKASIHF